VSSAFSSCNRGFRQPFLICAARVKFCHLKFRSCLTLFREAASYDSDRALFTEALDQFYRDEADAQTLELLG